MLRALLGAAGEDGEEQTQKRMRMWRRREKLK
jgi:hypothetical protein